MLEVRPDGNKRPRPFIVIARIKLPKDLTAIVRMRTAKAGTAGFSWRENGQKDFPSDQVVKFECRKNAELQEYRVPIQASGKVIHVRLRLPQGGADIASIEFQNEGGKTLESWRFDK